MEALSAERITAVVSSARSPSDLYETLSQHEGDALLLSSSKQSNDVDLLSFFYSTFFFAHLLTDQMYAQSPRVDFGRMTDTPLSSAIDTKLAR